MIRAVLLPDVVSLRQDDSSTNNCQEFSSLHMPGSPIRGQGNGSVVLFPRLNHLCILSLLALQLHQLFGFAVGVEPGPVS